MSEERKTIFFIDDVIKEHTELPLNLMLCVTEEVFFMRELMLETKKRNSLKIITSRLLQSLILEYAMRSCF